jgi:hypothetical protein
MSRVLYLQTDSGKNAGQFLIDAQTRKRPAISNGAGLLIRLGAYHFDVPVNLAGLTTLNFEIRLSAAGSETEEPLATKNATIPINNDLVLLSLWNSRSSWNAEIEFTPEELTYTIPVGATFVDLWMVVTATLSGGDQYTLGAGTVRLVASQDTEGAAPALMLKSVYDANNDGIVDRATVADSVAWANVSGKPLSFAPASHTHVKAAITDLGVFSTGNSGLAPATGAGASTRVLRADGTWGAATVAWGDIAGAPEDWTPAAHTHDKSEIDDLDAFAGAGEANLVPDPGAETGAFLRDDGTWSHEPDFAGSGASGLVPDPGVEAGKFLKDNGTWDLPVASVTWASVSGKPSTFAPSTHTHLVSDVTDLDEFSGAGTTGLVPRPTSATGRYLRDDGAWENPSLLDAEVFAGAGEPGLVPDPVTESGRFLRDNGTWASPASFTGAGSTGLVPNPVSAIGRFLRDDGSWQTPPVPATDAQVVAFEVIPPDVSVGVGNHYVCRWGLTFDATEVTFTFESNSDSVSFYPAVNGTNFLNAALTLSMSVMRTTSTNIRTSVFPNGRITQGVPVQVIVTSVGTYGQTKGMWIWFTGNWLMNA